MAVIKKTLQNLKPGKQYLLTVRAKDADLNNTLDPSAAIRFTVPTKVDSPTELGNLEVAANYQSIMISFNPSNDRDLKWYNYKVYTEAQIQINGLEYSPVDEDVFLLEGYSISNVFTVDVQENSSATPNNDGSTTTNNVVYYAKVRSVDNSGNKSAWTQIVSSAATPLIQSAHIANLTAGKIVSGTIGAHEITLGGATSIIKSSTYNFASPTTGWFIKGDGTASIGGPNGINFNGSTVAPAITLGSNVTILAGAAVPNSSGVAFSGLTITTAVGSVGGIQLGSDSNNQWLTSGYFRAGNGSKYILFDPAANSGAGSFTISSDVIIGSTTASTVVSNAATGASALQSGNGVTKNGSNQITQISGSGVTITSNGNTSGQRVQLDYSGLRAYNSAGTNTVAINSDGSASFNGQITAASGTIAGFAIGPDQIYKSVGGNSTRLSSADSSLWLYGVYDDQYAESHIYPAEVFVYGVNAGGGTRITGYRINMTDTSGNRNGYISTGSVTATNVTTNTITGHAIDTSGGIAFPASITDGTIIPLTGQGPWKTNLQWTNGSGGRLYYQINNDSAVKGYLTKTTVSDRRLKNNINQEIKSWLNKFNQIKIYEFDYNNLMPQAGGHEYIPDGIKKIGVIADEIEILFPEFVLGTAKEEALIQSFEGKTQEEKEKLIEKFDSPETTVKINGIYSKAEYQQVDYSLFVPLLMAVNLNQNKLIEQLSAKVDELESRLV
jgi:hypothetical protein